MYVTPGLPEIVLYIRLRHTSNSSRKGGGLRGYLFCELVI